MKKWKTVKIFTKKVKKKWKKSRKSENVRQKKSKFSQIYQHRRVFWKKIKKYLSKKIAKNQKTGSI